jgi:subtilisin family serine protease
VRRLRGKLSYHGQVKRLVIALPLCAAAVLAAPAQGAAPLERAAVRQALHSQAGPASRRAIPLPLPAPPRAAAAVASRELAVLARDRGPGRVLVGLRSHSDRAAVSRAAKRLGAGVSSIDAIGVLAVRAPSVAALTARLRRDPGVAYVERDQTLRTADFYDSVDPATGIPFTWAFDAVHAGPALAAAGGGSGRQVAVIDTGIDASHPDLAGHVGKKLDTASGNGNVNDLNGHGTFVSGLIAATGDNGIGGRGVAGNTMIFPVRASTDGSFTVGDLLRGLQFAITSGADIVNLSLAGDGFSESQARALDAAFLNNVLPVAAAGNRAEEGNPLEYPAAAVGGYRGGGGIGLSVGAVKPDGRHASFSAHNEFVSLAAPGADQTGCSEGVFSTIPHDSFQTMWDELGTCNRTFADAGGRYGYAEGTSFSAPIAAGIAALVWQVDPQLASEQVGDVLARSAHQTVPGPRWNQFTGRGVVDGQAAVALSRVYDTTAPRPRARAKRHGNRVAVSLSRVRDRTREGHRLAGGLSYALLDSTSNGDNFGFAVRPKTRPFKKTLHLRGSERHLIVASVCDRNGNCASKRLGRFRRR